MAYIFVIAGNVREFHEWCRKNMISHQSPLVCYIGEGEGYHRLQGQHNPQIVPYGTYRDRRDFYELEDLARNLSRAAAPQLVYVEVERPKKIPKPPVFEEAEPRLVNWQ